MALESALDIVREAGLDLSGIEAIAVRIKGTPQLVPVSEAEKWLSELFVHTEPDGGWRSNPGAEDYPPSVTIWTAEHVWFFVLYDELARLRRVPRNPAAWASPIKTDTAKQEPYKESDYQDRGWGLDD